MRNRLVWTLFVILLGVAVLQWVRHGAQYRAAGRAVMTGMFPCVSPVTYEIGEVDPRFGVSPQELAAHLREAESSWEAPVRRDLFELVPGGADVRINLVYDRRQAALDRLRELGIRAEHTLSSYKALKERYDGLAAQVDPRQAALAARLAAYKAREGEYNLTVAEYNAIGKATPRQVRLLNGYRRSLEREFAGIKREEAAVNAGIETLNALATTLNQQIVQLNINAGQYNREGSELGSYEEGIYRMNGGFRAIDIYKYADAPQLQRLLAHEMGHALGVDHVTDQDALMYPVNRGPGLGLRPSDLAELGRACTPPFRRKARAPAAASGN
jgi:hypothetical protein